MGVGSIAATIWTFHHFPRQLALVWQFIMHLRVLDSSAETNLGKDDSPIGHLEASCNNKQARYTKSEQQHNSYLNPQGNSHVGALVEVPPPQ